MSDPIRTGTVGGRFIVTVRSTTFVHQTETYEVEADKGRTAEDFARVAHRAVYPGCILHDAVAAPAVEPTTPVVLTPEQRFRRLADAEVERAAMDAARRAHPSADVKRIVGRKVGSVTDGNYRLEIAETPDNGQHDGGTP